MLVVLALVAVLTTAVSLSLRTTARAARVEDVLGRLAAFDRTAREAAVRVGEPLELRFDLDRGTVHRAGGGEAPAPLRLPDAFRVAALALPGRTVTGGEVRVPVSVRGHTPSYAALLDGPGGGAGDGRWLVTAGLTGRTVVVINAGDINDIFAADAAAAGSAARPAGRRPDAD